MSVIVFVQRLRDNGDTAEIADHDEVAVCTHEAGFRHIAFGSCGGHDIALSRILNDLYEVVDGTDGTPVPEGLDTVHTIVRVGIEAVVTTVAVGCIHRILVLVPVCIHRDIRVYFGQQHLDTCFRRSHVLARHLGQVAFEVVEESLAGSEGQRKAQKRGQNE